MGALNDLYGPSINEGIDCLVASKETIKGAHSVNAKRIELNRNALKLVVIDFIISNNASNKESAVHKISSTQIRAFDEKNQYLYNQWNRLISQLIGIQNNDDIKNKFIDDWWFIIFNFYQQHQRFYHTLNHILHLIKQCIKHSKNIKNITTILLSIWFHDIVYDATKHNNEIMSIRFFTVFEEHFYETFGFAIDLSVRQRVYAYIDATIRHQIAEQYDNDNDLKWFLDFDLSILGEEDATYRKYAQNVRKEYIHIKSPIFEQKRSEIMHKFLNKKQLYFTNDFQQKFEKAARQNIQNEIKTMQQMVNSTK